jgi:hypothetical protein
MKYIKTFENYDNRYTPKFIFDYINDSHESGWQGNSYEDEEWVNQFEYFLLEDVGVNTIEKPSPYHYPVAKKYAEMESELPPVVLDSDSRYLLDGFHRFHAALLRGDSTIKAYVGYNKTKPKSPSWMNYSF